MMKQKLEANLVKYKLMKHEDRPMIPKAYVTPKMNTLTINMDQYILPVYEAQAETSRTSKI